MPIYLQGIGQMTAAQQTTLRQAQNTRSNGQKRSASASPKRKSASPKRKSAKRASGKNGMKGMARKLVKGSAEAKRYMAKIRKMRK